MPDPMPPPIGGGSPPIPGFAFSPEEEFSCTA